MLKDSFGNRVPKDAFIIRATEVSQFRNCPRNWYFSSHNGMNLESRHQSNKLTFGIAWHEAMEVMYDPENKDLSSREKSEMAHEAFSNSLTEEYNKLPQDFRLNDEVSTQDSEMRALGHSLLPHYIDWAYHEAYPADHNLEPVMVEERLLIPVPGLRGKESKAYLAVRLDGVVFYGGRLWVLEHKTRSKSSNVSNPDNLPLDIQMRLQLWALEQYRTHNKELSSLQVGGAIYNLTRKIIPSKRVRSPIFDRHLVTVSFLELGILLTHLYQDYLSMRKVTRTKLSDITYNPQPWGAGFCTWGCAFRDICEGLCRGEAMEYLLRISFKERDTDIRQMLQEEMLQ